MKKLIILGIFFLPLIGCSASIGTPPTTSTTYTTTPAVSTTTYSSPTTETTVTRTHY